LQDAHGNLVTTGPDKDTDVTLAADGGATGGGVVNITDGTGSLGISSTLAQTVNLSLSNGGSFEVISTQQVVFAHGAAAYLTVTGDGTIVAGVAEAVTVSAFDQHGNPATGYNSNNQALTFSG